LFVSRISKASHNLAYSGVLWPELRVSIAKGNLIKNCRALAWLVLKKMNSRHAVRRLDLTKLESSADQKLMREQLIPTLAHTLEEIHYPLCITTPYQAGEWTNLVSMHLPLLEDGP
jgi:hypothetical protein